MDDEQRLEREHRLRQAALAAATGQPPEAADEAEDDDDELAPSLRFEQQTLWVDHQIKAAMARGDFDNLPGAGKPIKGLDGKHDPNWWLKNLVEREQISGVLPPALGLRKEDAELAAQLDRESSEAGVRRVVEDFNRRVREAQLQLQGGPPVITQTRDAEAEVRAWRNRIAARRDAQRELLRAKEQQAAAPRRRRWWRRRDGVG